MKIYENCGYFNEERDDEFSPYPGECEDCYRYEICLNASKPDKETFKDDTNI